MNQSEHQPIGMSETNSSTNYAELVRDARELSLDEMQNHLNIMFDEIQNQAPEVGGVWKAREAAWETYVVNEPNQQLQDLSRVMIQGAYMMEAKKIIEDRKEKLKSKTLPYAEGRQAHVDLESSLGLKIGYNHTLRDYLETNKDTLTKSRFKIWYSKALGGNISSANELVDGVSAEIIMKQALEAQDFVKPGSVRYGSVAEDKKGSDIIAETTSGTQLSIDAKAGRMLPQAKWRPGGQLHVTAGIPLTTINEHFEAPPEIIQGVGQLLALSLQQANHRLR